MTPTYDFALLGGGPAAMGVLASAARLGVLEDMLAQGVAVIEARDTLGAGTLGDHTIDSDTAAHVLLECLEGPLAPLRDHPAARDVAGFGTGSIPLPRAAALLGAIGDRLGALVSASPRSDVRRGTYVARVDADGGHHLVTCIDDRGTVSKLRARVVVFAMGGFQSRDGALDAVIRDGITLRDVADDARVMLTGRLFAHGGVDRAIALCERAPRALVLGGSHSAFTAARLLAARGMHVRMLARRRPRLSYGSRAEALSVGYTDFDERDVCPTTGRVNRLSGLRFHARTLAEEVLLRGDPVRVSFALLASTSAADLRRAIDDAGVIVPAFGYAARTVPYYVEARRVMLRAELGGALVDDTCAVMQANGRALPNVYALGLASGFVPSGELGGEPSFRGQTNGLWLYQHRVGERVVRAITKAVSP